MQLRLMWFRRGEREGRRKERRGATRHGSQNQAVNQRRAYNLQSVHLQKWAAPTARKLPACRRCGTMMASGGQSRERATWGGPEKLKALLFKVYFSSDTWRGKKERKERKSESFSPSSSSDTVSRLTWDCLDSAACLSCSAEETRRFSGWSSLRKVTCRFSAGPQSSSASGSYTRWAAQEEEKNPGYI